MTGEYRSTGKFVLPPYVPTKDRSHAEYVQAQRDLVTAISDRDHIHAYYNALTVLATRSLHPLREFTAVRGLRNLMNMEVAESVRQASPTHPKFPEYVGRKMADSVTTELRSLAETKPSSPVADLVRWRDSVTTSLYQNGGQLPKGSEAAQIAVALAGTYIREPAPDEAGERGFVVYTPAGLLYGTTESVLEDNLRQAAYTMTPPMASPFVPEHELDIYGGQYNFLAHEAEEARRQTAAQLLGFTATQHLRE